MKNRAVQTWIATAAMVMLALLLVATISTAAPTTEQPALNGSIHGQITDFDTGVSIANVNIQLFVVGTGTLVDSTFTDIDGMYMLSNIPPGNYTLKASSGPYYTNTTTISLVDGQDLVHDITLERHTNAAADKAMGLSLIPVFIIAFVFIIIVAVLISVYYSKLVHENILSHETRRMVYDYIRANPGKHYRAILSELNLKMGVLTHHLNTLERESYIKSVPDGMYRRYYLVGTPVNLSYQLEGIQKSIYFAIKENPGLSQTEIGNILGINRMLVNYHIKKLREKGLIQVEFDGSGRSSYCYITQRDT